MPTRSQGLGSILGSTAVVGLLVFLAGCGGGTLGGGGGGGGGGDGTEGSSVITMDNNYQSGANTGTVFSFDQTSGKLTQKAVLKTGGTGNSFSMAQIKVAASQSCVFLADDISSDIAAFTGPSGGYTYAKVGNYSNSNVGGVGALAVSKDGLALYSVNGWSLNLSHWNINSDCSLTHVQDYDPLGSSGWGASAWQ